MEEEFDPIQYIASYGDLVAAFGANAAAGEQHYLQFGQAEGRVADGFDEQRYLANYADLQAAFRDDGQAATLHYLQYGYLEGRNDREPLPSGFDGLQYIASYPDLIQAFGADAAASARHYLGFGRGEGRAPDLFDERQYLANYPDLAAAFGGDSGAATLHYVLFGAAEGRFDVPLPAAVNDAFNVAEDAGPTRLDVLANDATPGGGPLRVLAVDATDTQGILELTTSGRILYEPGDAFDGLPADEVTTDGFLYTVENRAGGRATAFVEVQVDGENDAPVANDDAFALAEDAGPTPLTVLANDTDVDSFTVLRVASVGQGAQASADGTTAVFDPGAVNLAEGETADVSFTYAVSDGAGGQDAATVVVTVTGVAGAPAPAAADFLF